MHKHALLIDSSFLLFRVKVCFCVFVVILAMGHEDFRPFEPFFMVRYQNLGFEDLHMRYTCAMDFLSHMVCLSIYIYTYTHTVVGLLVV